MKKTARSLYPPGPLSTPREVDADPLAKLPLLMAYLGTTTYRDSLVVMLEKHVIGHDVRDFKRALRGAPKRGLSASQRVPLLLKNYGVSNDRDALVAVAIRFVPGFRVRKGSPGGRPPKLFVNKSLSRDDAEAEVLDQIDALLKNKRGLGKKALARLVEPLVSYSGMTPDDPFYGLTPEQIADFAGKRSRYERRAVERGNRQAEQLRDRLTQQQKNRRKT